MNIGNRPALDDRQDDDIALVARLIATRRVSPSAMVHVPLHESARIAAVNRLAEDEIVEYVLNEFDDGVLVSLYRPVRNRRAKR